MITGGSPVDRPLRIALVVPTIAGGGAEFVAVEWARELSRLGHSATMITTHDSAPAPSDLNVVAVSADSFPARVRAVRRHVAGADYDVLLGLMPHWNLLALLAKLGRPGRRPAVLISGRNVEAPLRRVHGRSYQIELALCRRLYPRADGYVAISHPVAAEAAGTYRLDPARVWVVPNPATAKLADQRDRRRRRAADPDSPTVTLTVPARLVPQKQPEIAVQTAAVLRDRYGIAAGVEYFGKGPEEARIREMAARLDIPVAFHGWVNAWFDQAADDAVVLLPSVAEGFANVLVEAAAAGIPSVASSRALGVADAIVPYVTGLFALDTTPESFAESVSQARQLNPADAGAWFDRFSVEESGARLLHVIRSVLDLPSAADSRRPAQKTRLIGA